MSLTFIDTQKLPRRATPGGGEMTEVLNEALCGAKNVVATLHWLKPTDVFRAEAADKHQLVYLMDGKGAGAYLGPSETAEIAAADGVLKLFVLVVPQIPR